MISVSSEQTASNAHLSILEEGFLVFLRFIPFPLNKGIFWQFTFILPRALGHKVLCAVQTVKLFKANFED